MVAFTSSTDYRMSNQEVAYDIEYRPHRTTDPHRRAAPPRLARTHRRRGVRRLVRRRAEGPVLLAGTAHAGPDHDPGLRARRLRRAGRARRARARVLVPLASVCRRSEGRLLEGAHD